MYAGHFACAAVMRRREPTVPFWGLLIGVGLLDILFAPFVLLGIDRVSLSARAPTGMVFDSIDWSHSLAMTLIWSALYGLVFLAWGRRASVVAGVAVFSHFVFDLIMHPRDLALWPGSQVRLGLGLWNALPTGWWFVELGLVVIGCAYYVLGAKRAGTAASGRPVAVALVIVGLHVLNAPWFVPR